MSGSTTFRQRKGYQIILRALGIGALVWILESVLDALLFLPGPFVGALLPSDPHHLYTRSFYMSATVAFSVYVQRITAKFRRARKDLREERDFAEGLIETAQAIVLVLDTEGRIVRFNRYLEEISGHRLEEVQGEDWFTTFLPQRDHPRIHQVFDRAVGGTHTRGNVNPILTKDGRERQIEWFSTTLKDVGGHPVGVLAIGQDITERVQAEDRIEHLNLILRAIRSVNQLITREKDRDRLLKLVCESLIETRGYYNAWIALLDEEGRLVTSAEAGLGDDFLPLVEALERGDLPNCGQVVLSESGVQPIEDPSSSRLNCPLASAYTGRGAMAVRLEHGEEVHGLLCVSMPRHLVGNQEEQTLFQEVAGDIAFALHSIELEEKRAQAQEALRDYSERLEEMVEERTGELRNAHQRLLRQERLAVLGQLAGGVGHELRNPLGAIKNAVYFLNMVLEEPAPEVKETLEILDLEVATCEKIISDLLELGRTRPLLRLKVQVNDIVEEALSRASVPEGVKVITELDQELPSILADPTQLGQVFGNIIANAFQAMPEGGQLLVKTRSSDMGEVIISFTDTGTGIPEEDLDRIFEPLFTTRAKGLGMGLAITRMLVERHGGTVQVESEVGRGSTFTVRLPAGGGLAQSSASPGQG